MKKVKKKADKKGMKEAQTKSRWVSRTHTANQCPISLHNNVWQGADNVGDYITDHVTRSFFLPYLPA
jgi:predicted metal-dependent phosphotriesterase family hydrolase